MSNTFSPPPVLRGEQAAQLLQLRSYLFQMSDQLNTALSSLDASNFAVGTEAQAVVSGGVSKETGEQVKATASALKSLIIKTADTVRAEMDAVEVTLRSEYVAESEFGEYKEHVTAQFTATPEYVKQQIDYDATVSALNDAIGALEEYRSETQGYIKSGIVDWDGITPIIGIAIGQDLTYTSTTEDVDGRTYTEIDKKQFSSVFTASELAFYQGQAKVAYLSNAKLYITNATVTDKLTMGASWEISKSGGFVVKWIGG